MKKIYSFVAALVVAMVVLVSCGKSAYQAQFDACAKALEAKDYASAIASMKTVFNGDKAEAFDLLLAVNQAIAATQGQAAAGEQLDLSLNSDILAALNKAKGMKDADAANEAVKVLSGGDMLSLIPQFEAAVAAMNAAPAADEVEYDEEAEEEVEE